MGISKISYGSGDNLFEISYKDDEVITDSGANSYMSDNFEANSFAAYQNKSQTQFFEAGEDSSYNNVNEHNCMWQKWDGWNKTDLLPGAENPDGYYTLNSLITDRNGRRIITELTDIQRIIWHPEVMEDTINTRINGVVTNVTTYAINTSTNQGCCDIVDKTNPMSYTAQGVFIAPWLLYPQNKKQLQVHYNRHDGISPWGSSCTRESGVRVYADNTARTYPLSTALVNYDVPTGNNQTFGFYSNDNKYLFACTLSTNNFASGDVRCYICSEDELKKWLASSGLKFVYKNRMYKPVVENSVIVGYTDDLSSKSEWDDWHTKDDHEKPITPPPPGPPSGDDIDDHIMGAGSQLSGIATMWLLTRAQLVALHESFANAPANFDPLGSFISVMGLGISAFKVIGDSLPWTLNPIKIKMSNGELWTTGAEGHIVDAQVSAFQETGLRIQRKYNNFLDYSPYATHEIFIPMCGWITLPDIAVDRPITVTFIPDIESLKCRAVVSVVDNSGYRCVVGEKEGVMGAEIPFTNTGHSLWVANLVVNSADVAGEMVTGAIGAGFTKTNAQGGKYRPYEGFTIGMAGTLPGAVGNALLSGNINRTHFTTGNGSRVGFGDGENIQIKSTYHRIDKPNNYDHTVGKVCNKTGKLSEFTGFTVCENPHINFSATEREKEEIKQLLEQGVIL